MIRKSRKTALEHYQRNAGGEYIYTGDYMAYVEEGKTRKRAMTELWTVGAGIGILTVACGCIPAPGTQNTFYVLIPLMISILTAIACLWTLIQITGGGDPMKEYVYRESVQKMQGRFTGAACFAGLTALAELVYLVLNGGWGLPAVAVVALEGLVCGLGILGKKLFSRLKWQKNTGKSGEI